MTADALLVLQTLFSTIWSLFNSWHIPGTGVTPAGMGLFLLFSYVAVKFLKRMLSVDGGDSD